MFTAGPVGHKKAAVEGAGPINSGPRQGRHGDRPGSDRLEGESVLVTSRASAATAGVLAVSDGSPGQSSSLPYRYPVAVGVRARTGATVCNQKRETLVYGHPHM